MDEDTGELRAALGSEVEETLSFALRYDGKKRVRHADDAMARITAERLVQHLERCGFVLMKKRQGMQAPIPEIAEPVVLLPALRAGQEVVEDYRSTGLSLRAHPVAFLRSTLNVRGMIRCSDLQGARDGRRVVVPGIVLMRQRPGTAKGTMFVTIEDETGTANLVLWAEKFEKQRTMVLSAGMIACHGRVQREGDVIHVVTERLEDLTGLLRSVGDKTDAWVSPPSDEPSRDQLAWRATGRDNGIKVATRDFR